MKTRLLSLITTLAMTMLLSGCWIPEDFDANITVNKDGSYTFAYEGTLTYALALMAAKDGVFSEKDEANLKKEAGKISKQPGVKEVEYKGEGRYRVVVEKSGKAGEKYIFLSGNSKIFAITPKQDGAIEIKAVHISDKDLNKLKSMGAKINGALTVSVAQGVTVLKHNAQSEPKMFGMLGGYQWNIESFENPPLIEVQPSK
ncbi:hypothetical protein QCD60_14590 [Pokkaliibacter sp. MBI-7]|uniref:hypothetical protein n=1 Tax=Pokkaliibacter sp. MBI-7 TaxID=3040600 RepID=UPI0024490AED|nr:hypothetical protein [Pokkaliibacter sp. MBI-7]MDH2433798.1 hypothetical protein [Pokkaliibacter sp. MBI-7]